MYYNLDCVMIFLLFSARNYYSCTFGLINVNSLVSSDILFERETQALSKYNNVAHTRKDTQFYFSKLFSKALFFRYIFNILSCGKILKQKVVGIPLRAKRVFTLLITAHKYFRHSVYNPNKLIFLIL